jgi:DNA-binding MarR family transcriptional regulator
MGMTRGAVSKILASLEGKRLIRRIADDVDRRSHGVTLTGTGERLVPQLAALADDNDAEFFDCLPAVDRLALVRILRELVKTHGLEAVPVD